MRHTFCTFAAKQGGSNLELATAMGHRTLGMLQRYTLVLEVVVTKFVIIEESDNHSRKKVLSNERDIRNF